MHNTFSATTLNPPQPNVHCQNKQPAFQFMHCILVNEAGRVVATGCMKPSDYHRRNRMLQVEGLTLRWQQLNRKQNRPAA